MCTKCEQRVEASELVRGYEFEKDMYVTLTDEDLAKVYVDSTHFLTVEGCIDPVEIDSVFSTSPIISRRTLQGLTPMPFYANR